MAWVTQKLTLPGRSSDVRFRYKIRAEDVADAWWVKDVLILCVADGVGQAKYAAEAADLVVSIVKMHSADVEFNVDSATPKEALDTLRSLMSGVRHEFLRRTAAQPEPEHWRTTIAIAAVIGNGVVLYGAMGDSILAYKHKNLAGDPDRDIDRLCLVDYPIRLQDDDTATTTISNPAELAIYYILVLAEIEGLLLSTDGIERFIQQRPSDRRSHYLDKIFAGLVHLTGQQKPEAIHVILARDSIRARKGDDIGIAMACWR